MDFMAFLVLALSGDIPEWAIDEMKARPLDDDFKAIGKFHDGNTDLCCKMHWSSEMANASYWFLQEMSLIQPLKIK